MKGTVRREPGAAEDRAAAAALVADEKQRAENLMIVDLLRNDLARVSVPGSVRVDDLFTVETYPTLHTMTSGVSALLRDGATLSDILRAVFPCGSVTGAPKIRAMELIRALEEGPRGPYCGAIGWFGPKGDAHLNVAIRTIALNGGEGRMGIGSGVVFDSNAEAEYAECLLKARFVTARHEPFALIETMRWTEREGFHLLARHLARLRESAAFFLYPFDEAAIRSALESATAPLGERSVCRWQRSRSCAASVSMSDWASAACWTVRNSAASVLLPKRCVICGRSSRRIAFRAAISASRFVASVRASCPIAAR